MADPEIIKSRHGGVFIKDGVTVEVCIYRLADASWTLEVVDSAGTSTVWDDEFASDDDVHAELLNSIADGMLEYQQTASKQGLHCGAQYDNRRALTFSNVSVSA
jgi:uncharacterized protein